MEVMCQIASGENPLPSPLSCSTPEAMNQEPAEGTPPAPSSSPSLATISLTYLTDCYSRVSIEERNHPKVRRKMTHLNFSCFVCVLSALHKIREFPKPPKLFVF